MVFSHHTNTHMYSAGLPVTNDDADSTKSGSSRSDSYTAPTFPAPILLTSKGKQLPRVNNINVY